MSYDENTTDFDQSHGIINGGCHCGGIRYAVSGKPHEVSHCHCSMCRRSGSGAFMSWMSLDSAKFEITRGELQIYHSSRDGRRGFCPTCGAQILFFFSYEPEKVYATIATLDNPEDESVRPQFHIYTKDALRWLHIDDEIRQYPLEPPETQIK